MILVNMFMVATERSVLSIRMQVGFHRGKIIIKNMSLVRSCFRFFFAQDTNKIHIS